MKKNRALAIFVALAALVALLGGAVAWSSHTHPDGSPHDQDDCALCQLGNLLAGLVVVAAFSLQLLLLLLARSILTRPAAVTASEPLGWFLARAPPPLA